MTHLGKERERLSPGFDVFSGTYGAAVGRGHACRSRRPERRILEPTSRRRRLADFFKKYDEMFLTTIHR